MPLPTPPSKLGNLLPPEEFKARARTTRSTRKTASDDAADATEYGPANVAEPMTPAANADTTLRTVPLPTGSAELAALEPVTAAPAPKRKKQTAALLQPVEARQIVRHLEALGAYGFQLVLDLLDVGVEPPPVAGLELVLALGFQRRLIAVQRLVEAALLAGARGENLVGLAVQVLSQAGEVGEARGGGKERGAHLAFARQHGLAAGAQGVRIEPEGALEIVAAERPEEGQQRIVGQRRLVRIIGEQSILVAAPAAEPQGSPLASRKLRPDPQRGGVVQKILLAALREAEEQIADRR